MDVTARWKRAGSGSMVSMLMIIRVNQGKLAKPKDENTCGEFCQQESVMEKGKGCVKERDCVETKVKEKIPGRRFAAISMGPRQLGRGAERGSIYWANVGREEK